MLNHTITINRLMLPNRLVMPPMHTGLSDHGHVTDHLVTYYYDRAKYSAPGLIITEHSCITEAGRAAASQLSIADDSMIGEHRRITDAIHEAGSRTFAQLNHAGSAAAPFKPRSNVSASDVSVPLKKLFQGQPRALTTEEIHLLQERFAEAAVRAVQAGYDGVEIHSAHGYLLDQFYSPITNKRTDAYGADTMENRLRFLLETIDTVRAAVGAEYPLAVRLGGADYLPDGATEEDAAQAARLLEQAGIDLLDLSGGMCSYTRPGHTEPGYFGSMTEKVKQAVSIPVLLTGGVKMRLEAERLLREGKADMIGVGRALFTDAHWGERNPQARS